MSDGALNNVNPSLLKLCQDPQAWKEARKKALRERVFSKGPKAEGSSAAGFLPNTLPDDEEPADPVAVASATTCVTKRDSSFVLDQILRHKRQREEKETASRAGIAEQPMPVPPAELPQAEKTLKEKLLERLRKNS
jgi:hypothetical protein